MYRKSTDLEYYRDGRVVIDADGIPFEPASKDHLDQRVPIGLLSDTGSPEGKVTAPVGSIYTDTVATNGAVRWIKTQGTGNTGWVVEYGDTGWRDITSLHNTESPLEMGTGAKVFIRRKDGDVYFRLLGPITTQAVFGSICQLLAGWRPDVDTEVALSRGMSVRHSRYWVSLEWATPGATIAQANRSVMAQWTTMESWPTSLPGTPA